MNAIVILCGGNNCGKTTTIRKFFQGKVSLTSSGKEFFERTLDGKRVYAVDSGSPQERVRVFCIVERVNENIWARIDECNKKANGQSYVLIIPFTISENKERTKLNEKCVLEPIQTLRKNYNVFVMYLKKKNATHKSRKNALMKGIATVEIETTEQDYDKSAELETFLRKNVIKTLP